MRALADKDWQVQIAAVRGLGLRRDNRALEPLKVLLEKEQAADIYASGEVKQWRLKMWIAIALGQIGDPCALSVLGDLLAGKDFYAVRARAAKALGELGDARAESFLRIAANDTEANTRFWALEALARIR